MVDGNLYKQEDEKMNHSISRNTFVRVLITASVLVMVGVIFGVSPLPAAEPKSSAAHFDKDGNLLQPKGYREWVYVGCPVTPNDLNNGKAMFPEFHVVYIDPHSFKAYEKTGKFPDGTVVIKELVSVGAKKAPSGNGYFMGDFIGLEVAVKDSKRFPKEPGHWAYFDFMDPGKPYKAEAQAKPTDACNKCHGQYAAEDWVYTQYYPVLGAAKPKGK
jgi:hypothetical protein